MFLAVLVFFAKSAHAQDENVRGSEWTSEDVSIPEGMEIVKQGDVNVLVPKGGKILKKGGISVLESPDEYAARGFSERDARLNKIEAKIDANKKDIQEQIDAQNKRIEGLESAVRSLERRLARSSGGKQAQGPSTKASQTGEGPSEGGR